MAHRRSEEASIVFVEVEPWEEERLMALSPPDWHARFYPEEADRMVRPKSRTQRCCRYSSTRTTARVLRRPETATIPIARTDADRANRLETDKKLMICFIAVMVPLVFAIKGLTKGTGSRHCSSLSRLPSGWRRKCVTVMLATGALAMSRKKVIIKRLRAIQNFSA